MMQSSSCIYSCITTHYAWQFVLMLPSSSIQPPRHSNHQCGAFLSWVWQWSMPSPSPESSSCLSWRRATWSTRSPFSSLLPLARCTPLPSCSCCQRFAIRPYIFPSTPFIYTSFHIPYLLVKNTKLKVSLVQQPHVAVFKTSAPSAPLSVLWSYLFPLLPVFVFSLWCFSGSNKHCGRLFGFALSTSR